MLNVLDPKRIRALQKMAVEESRLRIPVLFGLDVIHGFHTIFPVPDRSRDELGPRPRREGEPLRGARDVVAGHPLDLLADDRHRPRRALGPHRRGRGRGPVPGLGHGARLRARLPGPAARRPERDPGLREALRRLRRRRGRPRLQHRRRPGAHAAPDLPAAVPGRRRGGRGHADERLQHARRRAGHRQPVHARPDPARGMGLPGLRRQRLRLGRARRWPTASPRTRPRRRASP